MGKTRLALPGTPGMNHLDELLNQIFFLGDSLNSNTHTELVIRHQRYRAVSGAEWFGEILSGPWVEDARGSPTKCSDLL